MNIKFKYKYILYPSTAKLQCKTTSGICRPWQEKLCKIHGIKSAWWTVSVLGFTV